MFTAIDHIGIAILSLPEALALYRDIFGLEVVLQTILADQHTEVTLLRCGDSRVELLTPTQADSPVGKFLAERGPGLHHIAYRVPDITAALERCRSGELQLIDDTPRPGAGGHLVAFIHPRSTGRALIELVEVQHTPATNQLTA